MNKLNSGYTISIAMIMSAITIMCSLNQIVESKSSAHTIYQNNVADINRDGMVNKNDTAVLLTNWGEHDTASASDLNRDGVIDSMDLSILLANLTPGQLIKS